MRNEEKEEERRKSKQVGPVCVGDLWLCVCSLRISCELNINIRSKKESIQLKHNEDKEEERRKFKQVGPVVFIGDLWLCVCIQEFHVNRMLKFKRGLLCMVTCGYVCSLY